MQKATQDKNVIQISTPVGKDALYLTRFVAQEAMSDLFVMSVNMYTLHLVLIAFYLNNTKIVSLAN